MSLAQSRKNEVMTLYSAAVLFVLICLISSCILWTTAYRNLFSDIYRQQLFRIRDNLFDIAARGEISFDDPAYHTLRYMLNGAIQYAHRISATTLFLTWVFRDQLQIEQHADPRLDDVETRYPQMYAQVMGNVATITVQYCINCSLILRLVFKLIHTSAKQRQLLQRAKEEVIPMVDEFGIAGAKRARIVF